jgi:hypothetical protein
VRILGKIVMTFWFNRQKKQTRLGPSGRYRVVELTPVSAKSVEHNTGQNTQRAELKGIQSKGADNVQQQAISDVMELML